MTLIEARPELVSAITRRGIEHARQLAGLFPEWAQQQEQRLTKILAQEQPPADQPVEAPEQ